MPEYTVIYSTQEKTDQDVIVTLEIEEGYTIINNNGMNTYTFTENGEFTFEYVDGNGTRGIIPVRVDWIDKNSSEDGEITSSQYEIDGNIIRNIPLNLEINEFMKNINSNQEVIIKDKYQNVLSGTAKIGTGMKAYVGNKVYTFVVKADLDGNGKLTLNDLAKMCLHCIEKETLTGEYLEAADLDNNNKITVTDLAKIRLLLIGKSE